MSAEFWFKIRLPVGKISGVTQIEIASGRGGRLAVVVLVGVFVGSVCFEWFTAGAHLQLNELKIALPRGVAITQTRGNLMAQAARDRIAGGNGCRSDQQIGRAAWRQWWTRLLNRLGW
jgi:hypothetical protein